MSELFLAILNMSLTASYVIIFVILVRLLLKKATKVISYALWGVVAFRLIIPFSIESIFSLLPRHTNTVPIPHGIIYQQSPQINSGIEVVDSFVSESLPAPTIGASINPLQIYIEIGAYIWILGLMVLLIYSFVSVLLLKRQLKSAQLIEQNVFEAKNLKTPFVLGLIRPKIYLPVGLNVEERSYILLHEQTHIHRKDHIIKILAFLILSIHWFNPLVWIAFMLMSTNMELSCDEQVLKETNEDIKKPYANSLLLLATGRHILIGSPLAFGEGNVKGRIKNVLNYKRPKFWAVAISIIAVIAVGIGLMVNPKTVTLKTVTLNTVTLNTAVDNFSLESFDRVTFGTLTSGNRVMDLSTAKAMEIAAFVKELRVNKEEVSLERGSGRDSTNQIHFAFEGFGNDGEIYNIYFNFNADFSEVWVDNGVKPSLSYTVKNPGEVKAFFDCQFGSLTAKMPITEVVYSTEYDRVKITFFSDMIGFRSAVEFETTDSKIVAYIDSTLKSSMISAQEDDLDNNHTNQYTIKLSNRIGGYSCRLYYDTLYKKAYIVKDGGLYETGTDFARYIDSFLENTEIAIHIDDTDAVALFKGYGWTLDYQISAMENKLNNISVLSGFNPNAYYFAYNNELSKDIDLDMSGYSNSANIDVKIYRIHESMPQEFYPIQDCRGIVVKNGGKIIGAFISAGRHSTFNACSLKRNNFEKVTGLTLNEWFSQMIKADSTDERLSKLEPEQVIEEYFVSLDKKDAKTAGYCISKKALLGNLASNMLNKELFNEKIGLPLTGAGIGAESSFDNLKSAKLLKAELIDESDKNTKTFRVTVDLQYNEELTVNSGEQYWDCRMVYESPQTGWKIEGFGH